MKVAVVTVSDRASRGEYEDKSGPEIVRVFSAAYPDAEIATSVVPDGVESLLEAFGRFADADWIVTTGGTGPAPRDLTPEATSRWIDRELPGIAEALRAKSLLETPFAVFSRGQAGMRGPQYVVNLPGSVKGARSGAEFLAPLLAHGADMAAGKGH